MTLHCDMQHLRQSIPFVEKMSRVKIKLFGAVTHFEYGVQTRKHRPHTKGLRNDSRKHTRGRSNDEFESPSKACGHGSEILSRAM